MKYFLIAGEASGDLHGANLIKGLQLADPSAEFFYRGGNLMEEAGGKLLSHYRGTDFMGYAEVIANIRKIARNLSECKNQVKEINPDVLILIDYPGFNLKMAKFARELGIPVYYYIAPKVWAWKKWRVKQIRRDVTRLYSILPFEKEFFAGHNIKVEYFGNPLVDEIEKRRPALADTKGIYESLSLVDKPVIALMAGSRVDEVKRILPVMAEITGYYTGYQFLLAAADNIDEDLLRGIIGDRPIRIIYGKAYELLSIAEAAIIKSGTSVLEAALIGTPQVVCYKIGAISGWGAAMLLKIRFVSLVNLLMDKEVMRELLQNDMNPQNFVKELNALLPGGWRREVIRKHYEELREMLGEPGVSNRVAADMYKSISKGI